MLTALLLLCPLQKRGLQYKSTLSVTCNSLLCCREAAQEGRHQQVAKGLTTSKGGVTLSFDSWTDVSH